MFYQIVIGMIDNYLFASYYDSLIAIKEINYQLLRLSVRDVVDLVDFYTLCRPIDYFTNTLCCRKLFNTRNPRSIHGEDYLKRFYGKIKNKISK